MKLKGTLSGAGRDSSGVIESSLFHVKYEHTSPEMPETIEVAVAKGHRTTGETVVYRREPGIRKNGYSFERKPGQSPHRFTSDND